MGQGRQAVRQLAWKTVAFCGVSVLSVMAGLSAPAKAQAQESGAATSSVEEVVVTARRREERLQEVPVAVTAVSGEQLEVRSVRGVSDLSSFTPNLRLSTETRGSSISAVNLRGSSAVNLTIANDPAVGIYFDEVPTGRSAGALLGTVQDMQSVQVLRGNQGTLFGRNNTGGAILLTPNRPNLEQIEGRASVTGGNYHLAEGSIVLSVPIVEGMIAARASFQKTKRDEIGRSLFNGFKFGTRDRESGRVALRFQPSADLTADLTYDFTRTDESTVPTRRQAPTLVLPAGARYYDTLTNAIPLGKFKSNGVSLRTQWDISEHAALKVITGYRQMDFLNSQDVDGSPVVAIDSAQAGRQHQFTGEINLSGDALQGVLPFVDHIDYVMGAFYFNEQGRDNSSTPPAVVNGVITDLTAGRTQYAAGNNSSIAAYGQVEAHFTERTSAWVGVRYTSDRRKLDVSGTNNRVCSLAGNPPGCLLKGDREFNYGSWSVGVRHALSDNIHAYARIANGQKAGGLDDTPTSIEAFEPEVLTDYEVGLKADWFDRALRTNIALFHAKIKDVQRSALLIDANNVPYTSISNAADGKIDGFELEADWRVVDGLLLGGSAGYVKATYGNYIAPGPRNLTGTQFPGTPRWSYSVYADYTMKFGEAGEASARLDYGWKDTVYFRDALDKLAAQDSVGLLNARLTYRPGEMAKLQPEIAIWAKNLTNTQYNVAALVSGGSTIFWRNDEPRTYGVTLSVRY